MLKILSVSIALLWLSSFPGVASILPAHPIEVECVIIHDSSMIGLQPATTSSTDSSAPATSPLLVMCPKNGENNILSGPDDISVAIKLDGSDYDNFIQLVTKAGNHPSLLVNGVILPEDATLTLPVEEDKTNGVVKLRYHFKAGDKFNYFWKTMENKKAFDEQPLQVAFAWLSEDQKIASISPMTGHSQAMIKIIPGWRCFVALALILGLIGLMIYLARATDAFRDNGDKNIPDWWQKAKALQKEVLAKSQTDERTALIKKSYDAYEPANDADYKAQAKAALAGADVHDADILPVSVGLALRTDNWQPVRASYSLSRTQLALWFTFTVASALLLWMFCDSLPNISGSMLTLVGISSATAFLPWMTDNTLLDRPYSPGKGFWFDLTTGFDDQRKIYRYQAVVVNILLVVVGINQVIQQWAYPDFDNSWLIFLSISAATYGAGRAVADHPH